MELDPFSVVASISNFDFNKNTLEECFNKPYIKPQELTLSLIKRINQSLELESSEKHHNDLNIKINRLKKRIKHLKKKQKKTQKKLLKIKNKYNQSVSF